MWAYLRYLWWYLRHWENQEQVIQPMPAAETCDEMIQLQLLALDPSDNIPTPPPGPPTEDSGDHEYEAGGGQDVGADDADTLVNSDEDEHETYASDSDTTIVDSQEDPDDDGSGLYDVPYFVWGDDESDVSSDYYPDTPRDDGSWD